MKKTLAFLTAFVFVGLVSCGPSAEDQAAIEQARADSIRIADSTANALLEQAAQAATPDTAALVDTTHAH